MQDVEVIQVIKTRLLRKGDGRETLVRIIEQYWDMSGNLLWQVDPCPGDAANVKRANWVAEDKGE